MDERTKAKEGRESAGKEFSAAAEQRKSETRSSSGNEQPHRRGGRDNRYQDNPRPQNQPQVAKSSLNMNELRELAKLINEHGFTDFEFENENIRVRLRKEVAAQIIQAAPMQPSVVAPAQPISAQHSSESAASNAQTDFAREDANLKKITSPIVGTFYRAPSPEAEPFVKTGSHVSTETIVCIVEAMKLMNEIPAEIAGEIVQIYVENGQPVEYGQPLFAVK